MFIKITWDEVGGRVGINRGRKAPYFTRHFDWLPALIPWFSTGSMVSLIPGFITYPVLRWLSQWIVLIQQRGMDLWPIKNIQNSFLCFDSEGVDTSTTEPLSTTVVK
jgi:hypothetical protein